jgi:hypothetical protein
MKPHSLHVKPNLLLLLRLMIVLMVGFKVMESEVMRSILVMLPPINIV